MRITTALFLCTFLCACDPSSSYSESMNFNPAEDSAALAEMIALREKAMIDADIEAAMVQFDEEATWINSQGYYFEGKEQVRKFHAMLAGRDSLSYYYKAGQPLIRLLGPDHAIAYYSWKMFWYKTHLPTDTTYREIGLMTLHARKGEPGWLWTAVTNQHTPYFYPRIEPVPMD